MYRDGIGKIQHRSTLRQFVEIALRSKNIHLFCFQLATKLIHQLHIVTGFKSASDIGQPILHACGILFDTFVTPMCRQTMFGNLIHTLCTNLHLHPFVFRSKNSNMQALITIALRY